jgi:hypothetical protein
MMPQMEPQESEREHSTYVGYEGEQDYARQQSYNSTPGKIYAQPRDNKNMLRFLITIISILLIFPFALLFMVFIGGTAGWIGFSVACFTLFLIAVVGIDKIK